MSRFVFTEKTALQAVSLFDGHLFTDMHDNIFQCYITKKCLGKLIYKQQHTRTQI